MSIAICNYACNLQDKRMESCRENKLHIPVALTETGNLFLNMYWKLIHWNYATTRNKKIRTIHSRKVYRLQREIIPYAALRLNHCFNTLWYSIMEAMKAVKLLLYSSWKSQALHMIWSHLLLPSLSQALMFFI